MAAAGQHQAVAGKRGSAAQAQQSGPTYNWKMATAWPGGPLMDIGAKAFAERMDQFSGGRFKIQTFPGGALGNALKVPETVKNGVAECGHTWIGYDWGKDPATVLFGGYAGSMDSERMLHWLYGAGGDAMQRQYRDEKDGVVSFVLFIRTAEAFLHSRKPVKTPFQLFKEREQPNPMQLDKKAPAASSQGQGQGQGANHRPGRQLRLDFGREKGRIRQGRRSGEQTLDIGIEFVSRHGSTSRTEPAPAEAGRGFWPAVDPGTRLSATCASVSRLRAMANSSALRSASFRRPSAGPMISQISRSRRVKKAFSARPPTCRLARVSSPAGTRQSGRPMRLP